GESLAIRFRDPATRTKASDTIRNANPDLALREDTAGGDPVLIATLTPAARKATQDSALAQNITTLHNRINELGVAEPVIQQQGAKATFDEKQQPAVSIELNESAGRFMRKVTRENLKKPMAVVLFEKGRGEVLTVATIQSEFGSRFQITGLGTTQTANDLALLLRAGALAAPMQIIEERLIGPSLGAENIAA